MSVPSFAWRDCAAFLFPTCLYLFTRATAVGARAGRSSCMGSSRNEPYNMHTFNPSMAKLSLTSGRGVAFRHSCFSVWWACAFLEKACGGRRRPGEAEGGRERPGEGGRESAIGQATRVSNGAKDQHVERKLGRLRFASGSTCCSRATQKKTARELLGNAERRNCSQTPPHPPAQRKEVAKNHKRNSQR